MSFQIYSYPLFKAWILELCIFFPATSNLHSPVQSSSLFSLHEGWPMGDFPAYLPCEEQVIEEKGRVL